MDRRIAEAELLALGGSIERVRRTGERRYSVPGVSKRVTANHKRRDASKALLSLLAKARRSRRD